MRSGATWLLVYSYLDVEEFTERYIFFGKLNTSNSKYFTNMQQVHRDS